MIACWIALVSSDIECPDSKGIKTPFIAQRADAKLILNALIQKGLRRDAGGVVGVWQLILNALIQKGLRPCSSPNKPCLRLILNALIQKGLRPGPLPIALWRWLILNALIQKGLRLAREALAAGGV